jgi:hypothetical protein
MRIRQSKPVNRWRGESKEAGTRHGVSAGWSTFWALRNLCDGVP